jgi:2'-5' RNA ligase
MPRNAVVALLEAEDDAFVRRLWRRLADEFGLHGVASCPHPHVSYLGSAHASQIALDAIDAVLAASAGRESAVLTRVTGLGVFRGDRPVVYLEVERIDALRAQHERIWDACESTDVLTDPTPLYRPGSWVPHVTLAISDLRPEDIDRVCASLRTEWLERPLALRTLAMLHQDGPTYRVLRRHELRARQS